jgi:hypothetical protein
MMESGFYFPNEDKTGLLRFYISEYTANFRQIKIFKFSN